MYGSGRRSKSRIGAAEASRMAWTILAGWAFTTYVLLTGAFIVAENRQPQATLAWMLAFVALPGLGLVAYILFGRDRKAFSRERKLARQSLEPRARPLLAHLREMNDADIDRLKEGSPVREKLIKLLRHNSYSLLTIHQDVEIQQNASVHYPSLIREMRNAQRSIHLQYFIWADDPFTRDLRTILIERAQAGVQVRLLYDPVGSFFKMGRRYRRGLREGGVRVEPASALWRLHTLSYRNHRKIAVIDGRIGFTGGMNIGQEQLDGGTRAASWRDTQIRLEGEGAAVLQAVFLTDWFNATRENLFTADQFPLAGQGTAVGRRLGGETLQPRLPVHILTSGPDSQWRAIRQLYFTMIVSAQERVRLQSPYFILEPTITEALIAAALSGVRVELMVSATNDGPNRMPTWAANTFLAEVARAGVKVHLYEGGYLHAKTISIDGEVCSIGSANLDIRSFSINYELNVVLYDARLTRELEAAFERDLGECRPFDPAEYKSRPALSRFKDSTARLLSPLM